MNQALTIFLSALTALVISAGGAILTVVGSGNELNSKVWIISVIVGLMAASKDVRSSLRLAPVQTDTTMTRKP